MSNETSMFPLSHLKRGPSSITDLCSSWIRRVRLAKLGMWHRDVSGSQSEESEDIKCCRNGPSTFHTSRSVIEGERDRN